MIYTFLNTFQDLIYQHNCAVCNGVILKEEIICNNCNPNKNLLAHSLLLTPPYCTLCGDGLNSSHTELCNNCRYFPLPIKSIRSIWRYDSQAEALIRSYKYRSARALAIFLADAAWQSINSGIYPIDSRYRWDLILSVPSTKKNLQNRGFLPMGEIVKKLATLLRMPFSLLALEVTGDFPSQASLTPENRLKYIHQKFYSRESIVKNKKILLIDDVITSGASITGASLSLLATGASSVDVLSFCRSEIFTQNRRILYKKLYNNIK